MRSERIKDWLEIVGMGAIVASLVFVGLQVRQDQSFAMVESQGSVAGQSIQLAELMQGSGELWRKGLDGEELSQAEQIEFEVLAYAVSTSYVMNWRRADRLGDLGDADWAIRDYSFALHNHVGLRRYFQGKMKRIKTTDTAFDVPVEIGDFDTAVINRLAYLSENPIPIPETKDYVFWN